MGGSILESLGLGQLVSASYLEYKTKIISLADNQNADFQNLKVKLSRPERMGTGKQIATSITAQIINL
jgi:hypothetical protein